MKKILFALVGVIFSLTVFGQSTEDQFKRCEELFESGKYQDAIRELTQLLVIEKKW